MEYPILIEGSRSGTLTETVEGLYTVFRADCPLRRGLIRLWLHGGGRCACLGLLSPCGERLVLMRRLSRLARAAFPEEITLVSDRPAAAEIPATPEPGDWRPLPDGTLIAPDGRRAIPAALSDTSPLSSHLRQIGGRSYLVFRL